MRILIVDDAPFIHEIVRHITEGTQFQIIGSAFNGAEAVEFCKTQAPDIIIMDIVMPQMNGIESTKEILKIHPSIRVVACSTVDQNSLILQAVEAGCCDYIVKPFNKKTLLNSLENLVQKRAVAK